MSKLNRQRKRLHKLGLTQKQIGLRLSGPTLQRAIKNPAKTCTAARLVRNMPPEQLREIFQCLTEPTESLAT